MEEIQKSMHDAVEFYIKALENLNLSGSMQCIVDLQEKIFHIRINKLFNTLLAFGFFHTFIYFLITKIKNYYLVRLGKRAIMLTQ